MKRGLFRGFFTSFLALYLVQVTWAAQSNNPFREFAAFKIENAQKVNLVFSGNVQGFVGPCGCAFNPKGGLDRRYNFLKRNLHLGDSGKSLVLDTGNALFPALNLDPGQIDNLKAKAALVVKGHEKMGMHAANVGYLDLAAGIDYLRSISPKKYPWISSNLLDNNGEHLFEPKKEIQVGQTKVVILGITEDIGRGQNWKVADPVKAIQQQLKGVDKKALVVVLSDMSIQQNEIFKEKISRAFILLGARDLSSLELPLQSENKVEFRTQIQGQQWGVVTVSMPVKEVGHWFSPSVGENFFARWETLTQDKTKLKNIPDRSERREEERKVASLESEILNYAPEDKAETAVYEYKLFDLGEEYKEKNEISEWIKKYQ